MNTTALNPLKKRENKENHYSAQYFNLPSTKMISPSCSHQRNFPSHQLVLFSSVDTLKRQKYRRFFAAAPTVYE